jgi:hypothetical protein
MYKIIGADGKEYGPISAEQIRQWLKEGRVNSQTQIKSADATDWHTLAALPEFAAELASRPPVPPLSLPTAAAPPKTSGLAITSLVLGVLGFCGVTAVVGLILGIVALIKINRSQGRLTGNGFAIAGICVSGFMLLLAVPIMAAMLLPALAKAKERAQTINCVNNLKQLGLAVRMYSVDHGDTFPYATNWCDAIQKNVGTPKVFQCPADPGLRCAFAYNRKLDGKIESEINPQTVIFFESRAGWNAAGGPELFAAHKHSTTGIAVGFADGSVRRLPRSQFDTLHWEP